MHDLAKNPFIDPRFALAKKRTKFREIVGASHDVSVLSNSHVLERYLKMFDSVNSIE